MHAHTLISVETLWTHCARASRLAESAHADLPFKGQSCVSCSSTTMGQSPVAPSPAFNKSSRLYNTALPLTDKRCFLPTASLAVISPNFYRCRREKLCNKLTWFVEKRIIADICLVELYGPNYVYFASVSTLKFWELSWSRESYFQRVYYLCITKVGHTQQRLCSAFSKQSHCQVFGYRLSVSEFSAYIVSRNTVTVPLSLLSQTVCLKVTAVVAPLLAFFGYSNSCIIASSVIMTCQSPAKRMFLLAWIQNQLDDFNQTCCAEHEVTPCTTRQHVHKDKAFSFHIFKLTFTMKWVAKLTSNLPSFFSVLHFSKCGGCHVDCSSSVSALVWIYRELCKAQEGAVADASV